MKNIACLLLMLFCVPVLGEESEFYLREKDDPVVLEAFAQARKHRDFFLTALDARESGTSEYEHYGAYLKFEDEGQVEYLWLGDVQKYQDFYIGVILSEPQLLSNVRDGATIGFNASDIYDWQISEKRTGKVLGAFLICATSDDEYLKSSNFACDP